MIQKIRQVSKTCSVLGEEGHTIPVLSTQLSWVSQQKMLMQGGLNLGHLLLHSELQRGVPFSSESSLWPSLESVRASSCLCVVSRSVWLPCLSLQSSLLTVEIQFLNMEKEEGEGPSPTQGSGAGRLFLLDLISDRYLSNLLFKSSVLELLKSSEVILLPFFRNTSKSLT